MLGIGQIGRRYASGAMQLNQAARRIIEGYMSKTGSAVIDKMNKGESSRQSSATHLLL